MRRPKQWMRCGRYGNGKTVLRYFFSRSLWPKEGFRWEVPAVTMGELVLMSWLFCTISEDHVAVAITSPLGCKKEQKGIVIPNARS